jgi:hypothetical protein
MAETIIHQIYFDSKSKANLLVGAVPVYNPVLSEFFENDIIAKLELTGDYNGIFSHDIANEMVFKQDGLPFTIANLKNAIDLHPADIYSFQNRRHNTNIVYQADNYHPNFSIYMAKILDQIGWSIPKRLDFVILFNHFVARTELYERYRTELLLPAMKVMRNMNELYTDAKYKKVLPKNVADNWGFYPYHPFICERLPSIFVQKYIKEIKCKHLY